MEVLDIYLMTSTLKPTQIPVFNFSYSYFILYYCSSTHWKYCTVSEARLNFFTADETGPSINTSQKNWAATTGTASTKEYYTNIKNVIWCVLVVSATIVNFFNMQWFTTFEFKSWKNILKWLLSKSYCLFIQTLKKPAVKKLNGIVQRHLAKSSESLQNTCGSLFCVQTCVTVNNYMWKWSMCTCRNMAGIIPTAILGLFLQMHKSSSDQYVLLSRISQNCSSQPSSVHWLSSSIFPRSFVVLPLWHFLLLLPLLLFLLLILTTSPHLPCHTCSCSQIFLLFNRRWAQLYASLVLHSH